MLFRELLRGPFLYMFLAARMHFFLFHIYLGVEFHGYRISTSSILIYNSKLTSKEIVQSYTSIRQ